MVSAGFVTVDDTGARHARGAGYPHHERDRSRLSAVSSVVFIIFFQLVRIYIPISFCMMDKNAALIHLGELCALPFPLSANLVSSVAVHLPAYRGIRGFAWLYSVAFNEFFGAPCPSALSHHPRTRRCFSLIGMYNCSFSRVLRVCTHWICWGFPGGFARETVWLARHVGVIPAAP